MAEGGGNPFAYTLNVFSSVLAGKRHVKDVSKSGKMWRRSIRMNGGYWQGKFRLEDEISVLAQMYNSWLGNHIEERSDGQKTWEGLAYELEFNDGHTSRRRSFDTMNNHVLATYIDNADPPVIYDTVAALNAQSISIHGRREERITMDNYDVIPALQRRDTFLKQHAYPWSRPAGGDISVLEKQEETPQAYLDVIACGYIFTVNWRFTTTANDSTGDLSEWIKTIVTTDCPFISLGVIEPNITQKKRRQEIPQRCWDTIADLVDDGDEDGNWFYARVLNERKLEYGKISFTPSYWAKDGKLYKHLSDKKITNPWKVTPAVIRDINYPAGRPEYGSPFQNARDFFPEEISVGVESGISWSALGFDEAELLAEQQEYQKWLEQDATTETHGTTNWKRRYGLIPGTPEWEEAEKIGHHAWDEKYGDPAKRAKRRKK